MCGIRTHVSRSPSAAIGRRVTQQPRGREASGEGIQLPVRQCSSTSKQTLSRLAVTSSLPSWLLMVPDMLRESSQRSLRPVDPLSR